MKRAHLIFAILCGLLLITQFQNCGDFGGSGLGGALNSGSNCEASDEGCTQDVPGEVSRMALNITSGDEQGGGSVLTLSAAVTEFQVQGDCDSGGFRRTAIDWRLRNGSAIVKQGRDSRGCTATKEFSISVTGLVAPTALVAGRVYTFDARLVALDSFDNETPGKESNILQVSALDLLPPPRLDGRACGSIEWVPVRKTIDSRGNYVSHYYVFQRADATVLLGNDPATPALCGYCKRRPVTNPEITLRLEAIHLASGEMPPAPLVIDQNVTCQTVPGSVPAPPAGYDGVFRFTNFVSVPANDPDQWAGRHARLVSSVTEMIGQDMRESVSTDVAALDFQILFKVNPGGTSGRGWTVPMAREAVTRIKSVFQFTNFPNSSVNHGDALTLFRANRGGGSYRQMALAYMGVTESTTAPFRLNNVSYTQPGTLANRMFQVANGASCDPSINGNIPEVPDLGNTSGELRSHSDTNSPAAKRDRLAVCLVYWFYKGFLGRVGSRDLEKMVKDGYKARRVMNGVDLVDKICMFSNAAPEGITQFGDPALCHYAVDNFHNFIRDAATRHLGTARDPTSGTPTQLNNFYASVMQWYLNWNISGICPPGRDEDGSELWYRILSATFSGINMGEGATARAGIRNVFVREDNGFGADYRSYAGTTGCASTDISDSY